MHAVVLTGHGGFDKLEFHRDWPVPEPQSDEVLIRVAACGLNNTDVNTRSAWYSKGNSDATTGDALVGAEGEDGTWGGASVSFCGRPFRFRFIREMSSILITGNPPRWTPSLSHGGGIRLMGSA